MLDEIQQIKRQTEISETCRCYVPDPIYEQDS